MTRLLTIFDPLICPLFERCFGEATYARPQDLPTLQ